MFGYSEKSSLVAIVVPDAEEAAKWAKKQEGLKGDETLQQLCGLQQMKTFLVKVSDRIALQESDFIVLLFKKAMETTATNLGLKGFEKVKDIFLHPEVFSIDNDLLTPTLKIKRFNAQKVKTVWC